MNGPADPLDNAPFIDQLEAITGRSLRKKNRIQVDRAKKKTDDWQNYFLPLISFL